MENVRLFSASQGSSVFLEASSDSEGEEKDDCKKANLHIDDWIAFRIDAEVNLYFLAKLSEHFIYN